MNKEKIFIKEVVMKALVVDGFEFLVGDKFDVYLKDGSVIMNSKIKLISDLYINIYNKYTGGIDLYYDDIKEVSKIKN